MASVGNCIALCVAVEEEQWGRLASELELGRKDISLLLVPLKALTCSHNL